MILALLLAAAPLASGPEGILSSPLGRALTEHFEGQAQSQVGDWVTFRTSAGPERESYWRIAIVGEEVDRLGRPAWWIELEFGQHHAMKAPLTQLRVLAAKDTGLSRQGVTRAYAAVGLDPVRELELDAIDAVFTPEPKATGPAGEPAKEKDLGLTTTRGSETRLLTLAGTVAAVPVEVRLRGTVLKRYWMSRQIPILHLAKVEIPAIGHAMEVRDFGTGAKGRMVLRRPGAPKIGVEHGEPTPATP